MLSSTMIAAVGVGVVIVGLGVGLKVQSARLDACKAEYAQFVATVRAEGEAAAAAAKEQELKDKLSKEKADAAYLKAKRERDGLYASYRSLRDQRAAESSLPPAAAGSATPNRACFDRAAIDSGMAKIDGILLDGAEAIIRRGDDAVTGLDAAKKWAQGQ